MPAGTIIFTELLAAARQRAIATEWPQTQIDAEDAFALGADEFRGLLGELLEEFGGRYRLALRPSVCPAPL